MVAGVDRSCGWGDGRGTSGGACCVWSGACCCCCCCCGCSGACCCCKGILGTDAWPYCCCCCCCCGGGGGGFACCCGGRHAGIIGAREGGCCGCSCRCNPADVAGACGASLSPSSSYGRRACEGKDRERDVPVLNAVLASVSGGVFSCLAAPSAFRSLLQARHHHRAPAEPCYTIGELGCSSCWRRGHSSVPAFWRQCSGTRCGTCDGPLKVESSLITCS